MILNPNANQLIPRNGQVSYDTFAVTSNDIDRAHNSALVNLGITSWGYGIPLLIHISGDIVFQLLRPIKLFFSACFVFPYSQSTQFIVKDIMMINTQYDTSKSEFEGKTDAYISEEATISVDPDHDDCICIEFTDTIDSISADGIVIALL